MKTFDLGAAIAAAFIALGFVGGNVDADRAALAACERVDMGGYVTFADPACAALANSIEPGSTDSETDEDA